MLIRLVVVVTAALGRADTTAQTAARSTAAPAVDRFDEVFTRLLGNVRGVAPREGP
jgi:hypothetical protein